MPTDKPKSKEEIVKQKSEENLEDKEENISSELVSELLESEGIPEDKKEKILSIISRKESFGFMGMPPNPLAEKITPDHITTLIDNSKIADGRDRKERNHVRFFQLAILIIGLVFVLLMIYIFRDKPEYVTNIIIGVLAFASGIGTSKVMNSKNDN